jgi:alkanesulfonate monooxygenase SsuD/methylene tetrahydromethanopterin reductase-like flavin-dependent oxidoreductase (luciferase family)
MRRLWTETDVNFPGRYFQVQDVRPGLRPLQQPGPPLWLAGGVDNAFRRVLRLGAGGVPISSSPEAFAAGWERIVALGTDLGRDARSLHRALYTTLTIDEDPEQAEREMRAFIETYYGTPYEVMARGSGLCAGTPEHCVQWVNGFITAGVETIVVRFGSSHQAAQLDRWMTQVLPHVREA